MSRNLPEKFEDELFEVCADSYDRGIETRRKGIQYSGTILILMLIGLAFFPNLNAGLVAAIAISFSSLCIVWAIYSVSASLNMQCDMLTRLLIHFGSAHGDIASEEDKD